MLRRLFTLLTTGAGLTAGCMTVAMAGPQTYATQTQQINAGIVILASSNQSAAPHALYNYDANIGTKPVGWSLSNPYSPSRVTAAVNARWPSSSIGNRIAKREAAYWEVFLSQTSDEQLANYNFLLLDPVGLTSLLPLERERLRRFVDHGGVLWIDPAGILATPGAFLDSGNNFPTPFGISAAPTTNSAQLSDFTSPLLSRPTALTTQDVNLLNTGFAAAVYYDLVPPATFASLSGLEENIGGDYGQIRPVSLVLDGVNGSGASTTIGITQIGAGYVVITSRGESLKLNRVVEPTAPNYAANMNYEGDPPNLQVDGLAVAKLVNNMLSLPSQYRMQSADSRHTNSIGIDLGGPLLQRMSDQSVTFPEPTTGSPINYGAVVFKGITIVSAGNHLAAYRIDPNSALTGNGDPGEGIPTSPGSGADLLWVSPNVASPISAPVLAEVPNPAPGTLAFKLGVTEEVLVTDGGGTVHAYNPVARLANGALDTSQRIDLWGNGAAPPVAPQANGTPNPPTVHEGLAYEADEVDNNGTFGRIWVINLSTGAPMISSGNAWYLGGPNSPYQAFPFAASPTVGYIPILDNSGGIDRVLYAPWTNGSQNGNNYAAGFASLWIGSRGEKPFEATVSGSQLQVTTRAGNQHGLPLYYAPTSSDPLGIHLVILDANGNPVPTSQLAQMVTGPPVDLGQGVVGFNLTGTGISFFNNVATPNVRIDYTIDWSNSVAGNQTGVLAFVERGRIQLPDQLSNAVRGLTGPLAISPAGTVYIAASGGGTAGLFGFQEQGRGQFVCVNRFELYPKYQFATQGAGVDTEQPVVGDNDIIATLMAPAFLFQQMTKFGIVGAPSVRNGQVIITVTASKNGIVPCTILMGLQSEPESPQLTVPSLPDGTVLVQADLARSTELSTGTAETPSVLPTNAYTYDPNTRLLTVDNLMNTSSGTIQQCLSLSQRLWLRAPGQSDVAIDPDNQGGSSRWSSMLWYTVLNGYNPGTGPVITGNSVYVGGSSAILSILNGAPGNGQPMVNQGLLYAFKANISPSDPDFVTTIDIPPGVGTTVMAPSDAAYQRWNKQVQQLTVDSSGNFSGNPDVEWPQFNGSGGIATYISRLNQTVLPGSTQVVGFAVGDNALVAQGNNGMYTFDRADFVIADQNRIAMFDPSGNPLWSTSSYADTGAGATGGAASVHQLVRPTRAYRLNQTDLLVVDSGANTVVRMNMGGLEIRGITNLMLDPNLTPSGYTSGEPATLSDPRDATTYSSLEAVTTPAPSGVGSQATDVATGYQYPITKGDGEGASAAESWTHYLIADTGNHRLIELVDRYAYNPANQTTGSPVTVNGVPQLGVLVWHSPAAVTNKKFDYNSITRTLVPTGSGTTKFVYIASVGTVTPTQADLGIAQTSATSQRETTGGGGILVFDPTQPGPLVFNQLSLPAIPANELWVENQATGIGSFTNSAQPATTIPLSNVSSVSTFVTTSDGTPTGAPAIDIMIACGTGVYEALYDPNSGATPGTVLGVTWMVPNQVYRVIRQGGGLPLPTNPLSVNAAYAERLSPNDVVIVNGYYGTTRGNSTTPPAPYTGEVLQLASSSYNLNSVNLGFNSGSITFQLPPIQGARSMILPVFADRR